MKELILYRSAIIILNPENLLYNNTQQWARLTSKTQTSKSS